jgi:hypothetical protein
VDKFFICKTYVNTNMIGGVEEIEKRPPIIILDDNEAFKGPNGEILPIEVVGERNAKSCYFKLSDIAKHFQMENLANTVKHTKHDSYVKNKHYRIFSYTKNSDKITINKVTKNATYLTYLGLLRAIFTTRSDPGEMFVTWATNTLFTAQLGTVAQKQKLAGKLLGADVESIKKFCKATSGCISCVYLFSLGTVGSLRELMEIPEEYPDTSIVYKYGRTNNLSSRTVDHQKDFGKMPNVELNLEYHGYIDDKYASKAETSIAQYFQSLNVCYQYQTRKELVILTNKQLFYIKKYYDTITELYRGCVKGINDELKAKDYEIALAKQDIALAKQETVIVKKDLEIAILKANIAHHK